MGHFGELVKAALLRRATAPQLHVIVVLQEFGTELPELLIFQGLEILTNVKSFAFKMLSTNELLNTEQNE